MKSHRWMQTRQFSNSSRAEEFDSRWPEFAFIESSNFLLPTLKRESFIEYLKGYDRQRFLSQLKSLEYQQVLRDFIKSDEFSNLQLKSLNHTYGDDNNSHGQEKRPNRVAASNEKLDNAKRKLADPEKLTCPKNSITFHNLVKECMSDATVAQQNPGEMVRIFTARSALKFAEEIGDDQERIVRAWRMFISMSKQNGYRRTIRPNKILEQRLSDLGNQFPNFAYVIDHIIGQLRTWCLKNVADQRIKPILLNGPQGTGKSAFAKALAEAFNTRYSYINIASATMGGILTGTSNKWGNGQPGLIFSELARGDSASPLILLDEIDKANRGNQYQIEGPLLELIEPQTSRTLRDEFGGLEFDASRIIFVATANDKTLLSTPLISRFEAFDIEYPCPAQRESIIRNMMKKYYRDTVLSAEALRLLSHQNLDLRLLQSLLDTVVQKHVEIVLSNMGAKDNQSMKERDGKTNVNPRTKFSLHGRQEIEINTVQICLKKMGHKDQLHFGFIRI